MKRAALVLGLLLVLAGCASLSALTDLGEDLQDAGYVVRGLNHNTDTRGSYLYVDVSMPTDVPAPEDGEEIAEIAWDKFAGPIDQLQVVINGRSMVEASAAELTDRFGERPAVSQREEDRGDSNAALIIVLSITAGLALVGLLVILRLRNRRKPPPMAPPSNMYPTPPPYSIPQPPPQYPG